MLNSLRRRPLDPPSSVTVTTAAKSAIRPRPGQSGWKRLHSAAARAAESRGRAAADGHHAQPTGR